MSYVYAHPPILPMLVKSMFRLRRPTTPAIDASASKAPQLRGGFLQCQRTQGSWQSFACWFLDFGIPRWNHGAQWCWFFMWV